MSSLALTSTEIPVRSYTHDACSLGKTGDELRDWFCDMENIGLPSHKSSVLSTHTDVYWWRIGREHLLGHFSTGKSDYVGNQFGLLTGYYSVPETVWTAGGGRLATPSVSEPQATDEVVGEVLSLTGMAKEELATALSVGRRSVYNWLAGQSASTTSQDKLAELANLLAPAKRWDREVVRRWLRLGEPSPLQLLIDGKWGEFHDLVVQGPRRRPTATTEGAVAMQSGQTVEIESVEAEDPQELLMAMRSTMRATSLRARVRGDWVPPGLREVTDE